jgi:methionyl-tRNA formyltransferase
MKVFLIIDETNFYQPNFVEQLLQEPTVEIIGCALVVRIPQKNNIEYYIVRNILKLFPMEILKLGIRKIKYSFFDKIGLGKVNKFYSVKAVLKFYHVPFFSVKDDINKNLYLNKIKNFNPDVILSSNSLYFKDEILGVSRFCINRHSSLLPSYGGLWPVFQAVRNDEKFIGVSVHLMTKGIDRGKVLAQEKIEVTANDTVDTLYQKCFQISAKVCLQAIKLLATNEQEIITEYPQSYYGFPSNKQWTEFRGKGKRFI